MANNNPLQLKDLDGGEVDDFLLSVQSTFSIQFERHELWHLATWGEFCEAVIKKLGNRTDNGCTSQQAFYKIRLAISDTQEIPKPSISPSTPLARLFPSKNRRQAAKRLLIATGDKIDLLGLRHEVVIVFILLYVTALGLLFFHLIAGLSLFAGTLLVNITAAKLNRHLSFSTVGEISAHLAENHYADARRTPGTYNEREIIPMLEHMITEMTGIDREMLIKNARF